MKKSDLIQIIKEEIMKLAEQNEGDGDCYEAAGRMMLDYKYDIDFVLVHGMVHGQGPLKGMKYGHAWNEFRGNVIDTSNGRHIKMDKKRYYELGKIDPKECKYYTGKQACLWMLKTEHFGPWEMSGEPIKINEDIPDDQSEIGRKNVIVPKDILNKIKDL